MDSETDALVAKYIRKNPAFTAVRSGVRKVIEADGLDLFPLSLFLGMVSEGEEGRVFCITPTEDSARAVFHDLPSSTPSLFLPTDGKQLYSRYSGTSAEYAQKKALDELGEMKKGVVVTSLRAFAAPVLSPEALAQSSIRLRNGDEFNPSLLSQELSKAGYEKEANCYSEGTYSVRGEVMDIFPFASDEPVRIYSEWDVISRIALFDPMTQRSKTDLRKLSIPLVSGGSSPYLATIQSYLGAKDYFVLSGVERLATSWKAMGKEAQARYREAYKENENAALPDKMLLDWDGFTSSLRRAFLVYDVQEEGRYHFSVSSSRSYFGNVTYFKDDLSALLKNHWKVVVGVPSEAQKERLSSVLKDYDVTLVTTDLSSGFQLEEISLLVTLDAEIFGRKKQRSKSVVETISSPLDSFVELKEGDYIVHVNYGIGRFVKIDRVKTSRTERDYIKIQYANEDYLYVPIEQADLVQKYIGNDGRPPKLDILGSSSWTKKKEKALKSAQELAQELVRLYAKRQSVRGFAFDRDNDMQLQFEASFPYPETPDQLRCIEEIKADMESDKVMDRLVCGDVGFGKTEIAFRAAFKAVLSGKQVAFLAPTVILAEQHYNNFRKRVGQFPVLSGCLSRFVSAKDQKKLLEQLREGRLDVLFGTHKILQKSVKFKNLGLLVVDEEQRFGVKDKERIKQVKANIDSLSLSATPIPRTLYMSLLKVRDMSLLTTAPRERQPIETTIGQFSMSIIGDAIRRELDRGGQVFYLHNRIEDLDQICQMIRSEVRYAIVESAHGQMEASELEDIMHRFVYEGIQVLVSTTIIENGIDIPNVNTMIIDRADRFGLAQLYQLRGRVGRSDRKAYCYLMYPERSELNDDALKRLKVLSENTSLGSGFKVAMKDMEIRGTGNILGREQSGHLEAVGLDMYMRLLEEEIDRLTETAEEGREVLLELDYTGFIPDSYISEPSLKFEAYKKIASISNESQLEGLRAELENRFGAMPEEVENLFCIAEVKIICRALSIFHLKEKSGVVELEFSHMAELNPDKIISLMLLSDGRVQMDSRRPNYMKMQTGAVSLKDKAVYILEQLKRLV